MLGVLKDGPEGGGWVQSVEQNVPKGETFLAGGDRSIFALRYYSVKDRLWGSAGRVVEKLLSGPGKT